MTKHKIKPPTEDECSLRNLAISLNKAGGLKDIKDLTHDEIRFLNIYIFIGTYTASGTDPQAHLGHSFRNAQGQMIDPRVIAEANLHKFCEDRRLYAGGNKALKDLCHSAAFKNADELGMRCVIIKATATAMAATMTNTP